PTGESMGGKMGEQRAPQGKGEQESNGNEGQVEQKNHDREDSGSFFQHRFERTPSASTRWRSGASLTYRMKFSSIKADSGLRYAFLPTPETLRRARESGLSQYFTNANLSPSQRGTGGSDGRGGSGGSSGAAP
ncbi:MAG TPA: hypothetical protein VMM92_06315, partial [Thermoanaerobaculia bacterium]|nr:hypothetical protein [Thermoanaerobaculia bacterium]